MCVVSKPKKPLSIFDIRNDCAKRWSENLGVISICIDKTDIRTWTFVSYNGRLYFYICVQAILLRIFFKFIDDDFCKSWRKIVFLYLVFFCSHFNFDCKGSPATLTAHNILLYSPVPDETALWHVRKVHKRSVRFMERWNSIVYTIYVAPVWSSRRRKSISTAAGDRLWCNMNTDRHRTWTDTCVIQVSLIGLDQWTCITCGCGRYLFIYIRIELQSIEMLSKWSGNCASHSDENINFNLVNCIDKLSDSYGYNFKCIFSLITRPV